MRKECKYHKPGRSVAYGEKRSGNSWCHACDMDRQVDISKKRERRKAMDEIAKALDEIGEPQEKYGKDQD